MNASGQARTFSATGVKVVFKDFTGSKYAFDDLSTAANAPDYIKSEYKKVGNDYLIYKAVVNQQTDYLIAKVEVAPNATINLNKIVFKTQRGALVPSVRIGTTNEYKLTVTGTQTYADEEILATIKQGEKYKVAGAFKLVHISAKEINVVLVRLNNKTIPQTEISKLENIYKKAGVNVNVTIATTGITDTGGEDQKIEVGTSNILSIYTNEQKEINEKVKRLSGYNQTTYYMVYSNLQPSKSGIKGFMALSGQFGYVFPSDDAYVAAHELGHGALGLEHPFKTDADQGKTNFLMDYSIKNELWHKDWKQINDPKFRFYNFQGDSEGASQWTTIDDKFLNLDKDATDKKKGSFSFLTQHGKIISLNKNSLEEVLFNYGTSSFLGSGDQAPGILQSFITKTGTTRKLFTYKFSDGKYYSDSELFIPPVIAESKIDGVIMFVPCLNQGKIYKFQKASLENFTNASAQPNNTPIDSFPFVPFSSQNPVLKNGTNVISQSFSISDGGELYAYDQATSDMSVGHCEKPELFYILKIGQIRRNYPEAFKLFTKIDNWQNPQNSSQSNGPAGGAPTVTSYQWATFLDKPENSILRSNYSNGTNLQNFFKVMYQQFSIAINTSIQSSNVFWTSLNSSTSSTEVLNQLQKESVVELGKRTIVKKILAIKILQSSPVVNETFEVELLKLIKSTTEPQTAELFTFLQNEIVSGKPFLKALISDIDNSYIFGENNRVKLVAILIGLWEKSTVFKPSREALKTILDKQELTLEDQKTIMTKTVNFNYESIYSRFWTHFKFSIFPAWAQSDTYEKTNADYDNATKKIKIETLLALGFFNQQETKIPVSFDPFEPILFTNNSKLSAFDGVDVNQENSTNKIFPAFIVYYADEEAGIQTFCDTALTVVDVASLAIPGAQLKVLGKVLFYADKISSVSAIASRATSDNPELKKILNGISLFTGLASATTLVLKPSVLTKEKFVTNVIDKINEPTTITNNIVKEDKEIVEAFLEKTKSSLQETGQFDNATALKYNAAINKLKNAEIALTVFAKLDDLLSSVEFQSVFIKLKNLSATPRRTLVYASANAFKTKFFDLHLGSNGIGIKSIEEVVDDFEHLIKNHSNVTDIHKYIDEMMQSSSKFKGGAFGMEILRGLPPSLSGKTLSRFEASIDDIDDLVGGCRFDMKFTDGSSSIFVETKNYLKSSISSIVAKPDFLNQFKAYIAEINSIDDMKYFFRGNEGVTKIFLKGKFKIMISNNSDSIFDIIWGNQNLRNSLFGIIPVNQLSILKVNKKTIFKDWVLNQDNILFKFIEIK